jgi:hypothetical protein
LHNNSSSIQKTKIHIHLTVQTQALPSPCGRGWVY